MTADDLLVETLERVLSDRCPKAVVDAPNRWPEVWDALLEVGASFIGIDESAGGVGGTVTDAVAVLRLCGKHAAPVPIAEAGFVGGWLTALAGGSLPDGVATIIPGGASDTAAFDGDRLRGTCHHVPFARSADVLIGLIDDNVVTVALSDAELTPRDNLAGEPRDHIDLSGVKPLKVARVPAHTRAAFHRRLMLARSAQMVGALEAISALTIDYANEREQFGRTIVSFQAVAHRLAELVEEVCLARMALDIATSAIAADPDRAFEIAALRAVVGQASTTATAASHQIHAAIGMTEEYRLHHFTRRLWAWSLELRGTAGAQADVGRLAAGTDLWATLTR